MGQTEILLESQTNLLLFISHKIHFSNLRVYVWSGGGAGEGQGEGVKLGECRQFSDPAIGVLSVLIEAIERIHLVGGGFMQSPPRDRSGSFILHFKKSFWTTFFMLSSVLGMEAVTEYAVGTALKELII